VNECRGDRICDDVSLICDKIEVLLFALFFFYRKMEEEEEEEEMRKRKREGRLTGYNLKITMD
jgi:hypothetical protein